jgi:ribokinase
LKLVALGDIAWDILFKPHEALRWGSDVPGRAEFSPGGSAANFAVWCSRLGIPTRLIGKVGDDWLGILMQQHLAEEGVENGLLVQVNTRTARIGAIVDPMGERAFIMDKDIGLAFSAEDFRTSMLEGADLLFLTGYTFFARTSLDFVRLLLDEVHSRNMAVAFDPASFHLIEGYGPEQLMETVGESTYLLLNEEEAHTILPGRSPSGLLRYAQKVVLKQGERGATYFERGKRIVQPGCKTQVTDTTGAGDAFNAAFLVEMLTTGDPIRALEAGNRLGTMLVGAIGSQPKIDLKGGREQ